jgi:hypothetical protein
MLSHITFTIDSLITSFHTVITSNSGNVAYAFFDSLATDGDLQEILLVGLFEPICVDPVLADRVRTNLGPIALKLLRNMQS